MSFYRRNSVRSQRGTHTETHCVNRALCRAGCPGCPPPVLYALPPHSPMYGIYAAGLPSLPARFTCLCRAMEGPSVHDQGQRRLRVHGTQLSRQHVQHRGAAALHSYPEIQAQCTRRCGEGGTVSQGSGLLDPPLMQTGACHHQHSLEAGCIQSAVYDVPL